MIALIKDHGEEYATFVIDSLPPTQFNAARVSRLSNACRSRRKQAAKIQTGWNEVKTGNYTSA